MFDWEYLKELAGFDHLVAPAEPRGPTLCRPQGHDGTRPAGGSAGLYEIQTAAATLFRRLAFGSARPGSTVGALRPERTSAMGKRVALVNGRNGRDPDLMLA
jgi:hypothetical protein